MRPFCWIIGHHWETGRVGAAGVVDVCTRCAHWRVPEKYLDVWREASAEAAACGCFDTMLHVQTVGLLSRWERQEVKRDDK